MPVSRMDSRPLHDISEKFEAIARVLEGMSREAGETAGESANTQALNSINTSLGQIVAALEKISGR